MALLIACGLRYESAKGKEKGAPVLLMTDLFSGKGRTSTFLESPLSELPQVKAYSFQTLGICFACTGVRRTEQGIYLRASCL